MGRTVLIHPLLEPEYSTWVMTAEGESLCTILRGLSESQLDSFSKFYSHHLDKCGGKILGGQYDHPRSRTIDKDRGS
jgi:hypothetical protein